MHSETELVNPTATTESVLRGLLAEFEGAPLRKGKEIRDLMNKDRDSFQNAALVVLKEADESRGFRYLVTVLWTHELLLPILIDLALPQAAALDLAQKAAKMDSMLRLRLTTMLFNGSPDQLGGQENVSIRLLEILSFITDAVGIAPLLRQILLHRDPRIRSKATLLLGRGQAGDRALQKLLHDEDARVRANAAEALWSHPESKTVELLREALQDPNNRVVGNAILGLYRAGDPQSIREVIRIGESTSAVFRATAVWVMGKTRDPRFIPHLGRLLGESQGQLRRNVFNALDTIKKSVAGKPKTLTVTPLEVHFSSDSSSGSASLFLSLMARDENGPITVPPTGFIVTVDSESTLEFSCKAYAAEQICVGLVLPATRTVSDLRTAHIESGIKELLAAKRRNERWTIARYGESSASDNAAPLHLFGQTLTAASGGDRGGRSLSWMSDPQIISGKLDAQNLRGDDLPRIAEAIRAASQAPLPSVEGRNIIVFANDQSMINETVAAEIVKSSRISHVAVHAISNGENTALRSLCGETRGIFRQVENFEAAESELRILLSALRRRYTLQIALPAGSRATPRIATIQVHAAAATGECTVSIPACGETRQPASEVA